MFRRSIENLTGGNGQRMVSVRLDDLTTDTIYWLALGLIYLYHNEPNQCTRVYADMFKDLNIKERTKGIVMKRKSIFTTHYIADLLQCVKRDCDVASRNSLIDYAIATGRAIATSKSEYLLSKVKNSIDREIELHNFKIEVKKI